MESSGRVFAENLWGKLSEESHREGDIFESWLRRMFVDSIQLFLSRLLGAGQQLLNLISLIA
jgi:hypothetical protein